MEFRGSPTDGLSLSFRPHPEVRKYEILPACLGSPARTPHIVLRQALEPGATAHFRPTLRPGRYRLRVWPAVDSADLVIEAERGPRAVTVTLAQDGVCPAVIRARAGELDLHLRSTRADTRDIVLERRFAPPYALTVSMLRGIPGALDRLAADGEGATPEVSAAPPVATEETQLPTAYVVAAEAFRGRPGVAEAVEDALRAVSPEHVGRQDRRVFATWSEIAGAVRGAGALAGALDVCSALGSGSIWSSAPAGPAVDQALQALHTSIPGSTAVDAQLARRPDVQEVIQGSEGAVKLVEGPALDGHDAWLLTFKVPGDAAERLSSPPHAGVAVPDTLPSMTATRGERIGGRYLLGEVLASGGFGAVHAARDVEADAAVVVKTLLPGQMDNSTGLQRFFNEARLASRLQHPNTVRTLDFGHTEDGRLFIVLERLRGEDLSEVLARSGPVHADRAQDIAIGVLGSLVEAHAEGLVHRDLKPANIFLVEGTPGPDGVRVVDFGIAKEVGEGGLDLTRADMVVGTMPYLPPELLRGRPFGPSADVYSLGLVLYHALVGAVPFGELPGFNSVLRRMEVGVPDIRDTVTDGASLSEGLAAVIMRAVRSDPSERWPTAEAMLTELKRL